MKDPDKAIVCGTCNVPVVAPSDPKPDDQIICPKCGARDTYKEVFKVCMNHAKYRLERAGQRDLADFKRKLGRSVPSATPDDVEEPFFKWQIRS